VLAVEPSSRSTAAALPQRRTGAATAWCGELGWAGRSERWPTPVARKPGRGPGKAAAQAARPGTADRGASGSRPRPPCCSTPASPAHEAWPRPPRNSCSPNWGGWSARSRAWHRPGWMPAGCATGSWWPSGGWRNPIVAPPVARGT